MKRFPILAMLLSISAVFSYINLRFLKLTTTIGLMVIALLFSRAIPETGCLLNNLPVTADTPCRANDQPVVDCHEASHQTE